MHTLANSTPTTPMKFGVSWRRSLPVQPVGCAPATSYTLAMSTLSSTATAAGVRSLRES